MAPTVATESSQAGQSTLPGPTIGAAHRAEVFSFQRLAARVIEHAGGPSRVALTEPARAMVLRHVIARLSDRLQHYRRMDRVSGFLDRLSATVMELIRENIPPDALVGCTPPNGDPISTVQELPLFDGASAHASNLEPHQSAKLHDLRLIYAEYLEYLAAGRMDPAQHLDAARKLLTRCEWLHQALLWVDGFASFTEQEMLTFLALARMCSHVDVTMLIDPRLQGSSSEGLIAASRLFARTQESLARLRQRIQQSGLNELPPMLLDAPVMPRLSNNAGLQSIEANLFCLPARVLPFPPGAPQGVELVELPSRRVEVEFAVSCICDWVQNRRNPLRYRDIAVVVRDLEPYHALLADALRSRNIPFFIDRRRPVAHHPLIEFVRSAVRIAGEDLSLESTRLLLKTDLLPISRAAIDELENHLLACGIAGRAQWDSPWTSQNSRAHRNARKQQPDPEIAAATHRLNASRQAVLACLLPWSDWATAARIRTGSEWAKALIELLRRCGAERTIASWAARAEIAGELDEAEEHEQTWTAVLSVIDDLDYSLADAAIPLEELGDLLSAGLSSLTLGLAPPTVDQVLIGSIERSRHPDIAAAVILGFNDGVFPRRAAEDSVLNDDDRDLLIERGVLVTPGARRRLLDESLLVYIAATRPSQQLVITYAASDDNGKTLRPSPHVRDLCEALPGLQVRSVADPLRSREGWDVRAPSDLRRRIAEEFRSRPPAEADRCDARTLWNGLYAGSRLNLKDDARARSALSALDEREQRHLSENMVSRLFGHPLQTSISQLESYASCPFQFFARHGLRLRERTEAVLEPVDVGQVHHAILEHFAEELGRTGRGIGDLSEAEIHACLSTSCHRAEGAFSLDGIFNARNAYILRRSGERLARVLRAQQQRCAGRSMRTARVELPFGFNLPGGLPALQIATPKNRHVSLRGYIDRVDLVEYMDEVLGIVVDYKTTRARRLDLGAVYYGLSLQLPAYLLAIAESGRTPAGRPIRPAAGLYMSLASRYQLVAHPEKTSPREDLLGGTFRPRGLILADALPALDPTEIGWSQHYSAFRRKDGDYAESAGSDVASAREFDAVLGHTRRKLGELADGILDGDVAVSPCRNAGLSPCSWCGLSIACRVEIGISEARYAERLKRSDVLKRLGAVTPPEISESS